MDNTTPPEALAKELLALAEKATYRPERPVSAGIAAKLELAEFVRNNAEAIARALTQPPPAAGLVEAVAKARTWIVALRDTADYNEDDPTKANLVVMCRDTATIFEDALNALSTLPALEPSAQDTEMRDAIIEVVAAWNAVEAASDAPGPGLGNALVQVDDACEALGVAVRKLAAFVTTEPNNGEQK